MYMQLSEGIDDDAELPLPGRRGAGRREHGDAGPAGGEGTALRRRAAVDPAARTAAAAVRRPPSRRRFASRAGRERTTADGRDLRRDRPRRRVAGVLVLG